MHVVAGAFLAVVVLVSKTNGTAIRCLGVLPLLRLALVFAFSGLLAFVSFAFAFCSPICLLSLLSFGNGLDDRRNGRAGGRIAA